jgi:hypothetical protein
MYDCDNGPVVCTKKYGRKDEGYSPSSQSIAPGSWRLNLTCIIMDQMYTPKLRITTVYRPIWARRRWLRPFMSRINPRPKQPMLRKEVSSCVSDK